MTRIPRADQLLKYPTLKFNELSDQEKYDLQWYVVGESGDFTRNIPEKVRIWNTNYVVWRAPNNTLVGLSDACTHKGASLSCGYIKNNHIICPYHGYEFDANGTLDKVPGLEFNSSYVYNLNKYEVIERNGWVYLNTAPLNKSNPSYDTNIYVEPEASKDFSRIQLNMEYNCYSRILSENSLDIMHIAFVHTFGNANRPSPYREDPPKLVGRNHYMTTYYYEAGEDSLARKIFGTKNLVVENEFILPHTTVARIIFGDFVSTVITFALPIGDNKSRLFVKTYRNFWQNSLGDLFTANSMYNTMLQDKIIVENIDERYMDGKFNMKFDKLQNVYKSFYKKFIRK